MKTKDLEVLRPFGPTIAKVKIPDNLVKELNDYTDDIINNEQKKKDLDGFEICGVTRLLSNVYYSHS